MRLAASEAKDVKDLLNSRLGIKYESLSETDEVWKKYRAQICFNSKDEN